MIDQYFSSFSDAESGNAIQTYKYPNPSPLSPTKDVINGPINETFVLNCPKCASHFKSSQLLQEHLKIEHNVCNYIDGLNTEQNQHLKMGSDLVMNMEEDDAKENEDEDCDMMGDDHEEATDDADFEGPQESGQDLPYSGGQNVVSIHLIP